jgi:hypothetical protein
MFTLLGFQIGAEQVADHIQASVCRFTSTIFTRKETGSEGWYMAHYLASLARLRLSAPSDHAVNAQAFGPETWGRWLVK